MLKQGDLVKYHRQDARFDQGFVLGQLYPVTQRGDDLIVTDPKGRGVILMYDNEPTDAAYHFAKFKPVLDLPRGAVSK